MIKRISLVWKREDLTRDDFAAAWLDEHARAAKRLPGLRQYVIDIVEDPRPGNPDGVATLRFDSREACDSAFAERELAEQLHRTRDEFAARVEVFFVDETVVHDSRVRSGA